MVKHVAIAFAVGGSISAFLYCCMNAGLRAGLAAYDYLARRRDAHERTQA